MPRSNGWPAQQCTRCSPTHSCKRFPRPTPPSAPYCCCSPCSCGTVPTSRCVYVCVCVCVCVWVWVWVWVCCNVEGVCGGRLLVLCRTVPTSRCVCVCVCVCVLQCRRCVWWSAACFVQDSANFKVCVWVCGCVGVWVCCNVEGVCGGRLLVLCRTVPNSRCVGGCVGGCGCG